ncbi:Protein argonaute [Phytophthora fragariae]|uniref:Protein argonaute n=1 Tax=Phytophthora fragariae TaxID=53985 RepID=A0A6G0NM25_9STRA|nr:Protein argonaute [Phytophthora fragariae]
MSYSGGGGGGYDQRGGYGDQRRGYDDPNRPSSSGSGGGYGGYGQQQQQGYDQGRGQQQQGYDQRGGQQQGYDQRGGQQQGYDQRGGQYGHDARGGGGGDYSSRSSGYDDYSRGGYGGSSSGGGHGYDSGRGGDYGHSSGGYGGGGGSSYDDRSRGGSYSSGVAGYGASAGASSGGVAVVTVEEAVQAMGEAARGTMTALADMAAVMRTARADTADGTTEAAREKSEVTGLQVAATAGTEGEQAALQTAGMLPAVAAVATTADMAAAEMTAGTELAAIEAEMIADMEAAAVQEETVVAVTVIAAAGVETVDMAAETEGPGAGAISGSGYEQIGQPIADPRIQDEWTGRAGVREVRADDADLQQEVQICRRPGIAQRGKTTQLNINYFGISLDSAPPEIFKYHVNVERSPDLQADSKYGPSGADQKDDSMGDEPKQEGKDVKDVEMAEPSADAPPKREARPERPLPRSLVRNVINAALRQYETEFNGIRVVHDGMAALYSPAMLPWNAKDFADINPDSNGAPAPPQQPPAGGDGAPRRGFRGPRTFIVKMKLVETISTSSLTDYYANPDTNVMPVLQALDVVARHLGAQRLIAVGRNFFTMKKTHTLKGGKELCWGYHQAIRLADHKLLMNVDQAATVFYSPGPLMQLAMAALRARGPDEVRDLSERDMKSLARALRKIEVVPTHRKDRKRAIFGVSAQPASLTMVDIKGENMSVATYFSRKYNMQLRYPNLPLVNVGSKRPGKENWLPIEVCEVAPGQRCANINDLDTAEIIRQTSQPPRNRQENIMEQVRQAGFENDPFLAAFGIKVDQRLVSTEAHVIDAPDVQYHNVSERPAGGQWSLNSKRFVEGVPVRNWGVIVAANVNERDVRSFVTKLADLGDQRGLPFEEKNPMLIHQDQHRGAQVEELMKMCHQELEHRNAGPPQFLLVILPAKNSPVYGDVKRMSDTVLGLPSQCIASQNLPRANPQFCANVCLKINMKLKGKNAVLRDELPLISSAPTIIIGADVEHPRSGMGGRPSIAAVVASMDRYSAQYAARVAAQKASSDIQQLPNMLRELFLAYYENTQRKPEHVVYYRDGVSEDQMFDILQTEMRALRKAFKMISDDYNPPVTFVVVNKRHHLRAFPVNARDADRKGNVMPGTVIDTGVVNPHRFDFFLYGHSGIQGTTVPAHYTVLHDENKMSAEDIQRLTYHLGYTFSRCTRSVSFVTPVYYAHLAAARARFFLNDGSDGASTCRRRRKKAGRKENMKNAENRNCYLPTYARLSGAAEYCKARWASAVRAQSEVVATPSNHLQGVEHELFLSHAAERDSRPLILAPFSRGLPAMTFCIELLGFQQPAECALKLFDVK